jgi:tetratricopeptide (TPR) repeat protein
MEISAAASSSRESVRRKRFCQRGSERIFLDWMHALEPPDSHFLNATNGWLELGSPAEAQGEWERIAEIHRQRPDVLDARWRIQAARKDWSESLSTARQLLESAPESPIGWINEAYSLHELKRTQEAWDQLLPLASRFPKISVIAYNLACYACQLGRLDQAQQFLERAIQIKGKNEIKQMALLDPDLQAMRETILGL